MDKVTGTLLILAFIIVGLIIVPKPQVIPNCTTQRITILEKDLEIEKLSNQLSLLQYTIKEFKNLSTEQKEELKKLHKFITGIGGEPTL